MQKTHAETGCVYAPLTVLIGVDSCGGDSGGPLVYRKGNDAEEPWFQFKNHQLLLI